MTLTEMIRNHADLIEMFTDPEQFTWLHRDNRIWMGYFYNPESDRTFVFNAMNLKQMGMGNAWGLGFIALEGKEHAEDDLSNMFYLQWRGTEEAGKTGAFSNVSVAVFSTLGHMFNEFVTNVKPPSFMFGVKPNEPESRLKLYKAICSRIQKQNYGYTFSEEPDPFYGGKLFMFTRTGK